MCNDDADLIRQATIAHLTLMGGNVASERTEAIQMVADALAILHDPDYHRSSYLAWSAAGYETAMRASLGNETR